MAYFNIPNVRIVGLSACVPQKREEIKDYPLFNQTEVDRMLPFFGLQAHHIADESICASDLCYEAAINLLQKTNTPKEDVDCLIFVTAAPDYIFPATSCVLHNRLGLKRECSSFDIPFGCSGWVYAVTVMGSLLQNGTIKKGLLLVGDTPTRAANHDDKSVYPFFGDAGTATLLEYSKGTFGIRAEIGTIEKGYDKIIVNDGGFRHPTTIDSLAVKEISPGVNRCGLDTQMDGMDVFSMSTKQDPVSISQLLEKSDVHIDEVDCFGFHQTNKFLMERVVKKMGIDKEKVPFSLQEYANTSGASIPLTLVTERSKALSSSKMKIVACALGVGLSYGAMLFESDNLIIPEIIELKATDDNAI